MIIRRVHYYSSVLFNEVRGEVEEIFQKFVLDWILNRPALDIFDVNTSVSSIVCLAHDM